MEHSLKIHPQYFHEVCSGDKPYQLRKDDRVPQYAASDVLVLREYDPERKIYTGNSVRAFVHSVQRDGPGLEAGYCVMAVGIGPRRFSAEQAGKAES